MKVKQRIDFVEGDIDTDSDLMICVGNKKYGEVLLCFKAGGINVGFAKIKLFTSNKASDADAVFEDAVSLGEEIARRWNEKANPLKEHGESCLTLDI